MRRYFTFLAVISYYSRLTVNLHFKTVNGKLGGQTRPHGPYFFLPPIYTVIMYNNTNKLLDTSKSWSICMHAFLKTEPWSKEYTTRLQLRN
jgi:hypothetical protein